MKVVLTGPIGSGKSTVVRAAMKQLGWVDPAGFFTHWDGAGRGADVLYVETWSGEKRPLARRCIAPAAPDSLPYILNQADPMRMAVACLADAGRPVVIDELGLVELGDPGIPAAVAKLFRRSAPVLAVIQQRVLEPWLAAIGRENVAHLLEVDAATRAALPDRIAALLRA